MTLNEKVGYLLSAIYCDSCRFGNISEELAIEMHGYYGCDGCVRKSMGWEGSSELAELIIKTVKEDSND